MKVNDIIRCVDKADAIRTLQDLILGGFDGAVKRIESGDLVVIVTKVPRDGVHGSGC